MKELSNEVLYFTEERLGTNTTLIIDKQNWVHCFNKGIKETNYKRSIVGDNKDGTLYILVVLEMALAYAVYEYRRRLKKYYPNTVKKAVEIVHAARGREA